MPVVGSGDPVSNPTVRDLITRAAKFVHILGSDETFTAAEATDALVELNGLIEQVNIDKTMAYYQTEITVPMVAGQQTYTIGPSSANPNIVASRPVEVLSAFSRRLNVDLPCFIARKQDWDALQQKNIQIAGWEQVLYYEPTFPSGTLKTYMIPADAQTTVFLTVLGQLSPYTTLEELINVPPGYYTWLARTLGRWLCPEYGFTFTEEMKALQQQSEALVKRNNIKRPPVALSGLSALSASRSAGSYNVYADEPARNL